MNGPPAKGAHLLTVKEISQFVHFDERKKCKKCLTNQDSRFNIKAQRKNKPTKKEIKNYD
jgi:hypothetical protein